MDKPQYSTLYAALQAVPDPRHRRGQRYPWPLLLTLIAAALASGQPSVWGMAHWAALHAEAIIDLLGLEVKRVPSASTLYRAVQHVDGEALDRCLGLYNATLARLDPTVGCLTLATGQIVQGQAVDGKVVRGASAHGQTVQLVSLVRHGDGVTLRQVRVASRRGEQTATPTLLARHDLQGTVTTFDAGLSHRPLAQQIIDQQGHYLMLIKRNHRDLYEHLTLWFDPPSSLAWLPCDGPLPVRQAQTCDKGHGRVEVRTLLSRADIAPDLPWPHAAQVLRRTCRRHNLKTGQTSVETTYGVTSLTAAEATPQQLEQLWRAHWTIENRSHYVRDVTLGEDNGQVHVGHAPEVLASLRNALLALLRAQGWSSIAAALRHYGSSVVKAFVLIGACPAARL